MENVLDQSVGIIEKQYKAGLDHQKTTGLATKCPKFERYKAGEQWPAATERTRNMPRPVFNIIRFILNHKTASVNNENLRMVFSPEEVPDPNADPKTQGMEPEKVKALTAAINGADAFTKFAEATWENIKQDELNEDALEDAATSGTAWWHYYWDDSRTGGITTVYKGDMAGEIIDSLDIFPGNPQQKEIQKQPYIIIRSRDSVANVKELAIANKLPVEQIDMITPDKDTNNEGYDSAKNELSDSEMVTVLTRYIKVNNRVFFCKVASGVKIKPETDTGMELYPIASMPWEKRKKSIFGVSEVEGLIPSQNAINFNMAMMMLSIQDTGWPKLLVKHGALQQQITNTPGEIITDNVPLGQGDGMKYMQPASFNQFAPVLVDKIIEFTRTFTGANEVSTGDPFTKDLNAAAIVAMQNAAKIPVDMIKKRFKRSQEDIGRIWEQFFKVKYNLPRVVTIKQDDQEVPMQFRGSDYAGVPMKLKIDIGASSTYSESLIMATLDKLVDLGIMNGEQYVRYSPDTVIPFKAKFLEELKQQAQAQQAETQQLLSMLSPEEQQAFSMAPPEQQQAILEQLRAQQQPMSGNVVT